MMSLESRVAKWLKRKFGIEKLRVSCFGQVLALVRKDLLSAKV